MELKDQFNNIFQSPNSSKNLNNTTLQIIDILKDSRGTYEDVETNAICGLLINIVAENLEE